MATRIKRLYRRNQRKPQVTRNQRKPQVTRNHPETWLEAGATLVLAIIGIAAWAVFLILVFARSVP